MKKILAAPLATLCFLVNPLWVMSGCDLYEEPEFEYSQEDMIQTFEKVSLTQSYITEDGEKLDIVLKVDGLDMPQTASLFNPFAMIQNASACGEEKRDFVLSASACATLYRSELTFSGTLSITSTPEEGEPTTIVQDIPLETGTFTVDGTTLSNFSINATAEMGEDSYITEIYSSDGTAEKAKVVRVDSSM